MMSNRFQHAARHAAATAEHILHVAGQVPDSAIAEMLDIGATLAELELAVAYARGEGDVVCRMHYALTGRVKRIFDILVRNETRGDDPGRYHRGRTG